MRLLMHRRLMLERASYRHARSSSLVILSTLLITLTAACGGDVQSDEAAASPTAASTGTTDPPAWQVSSNASASPQITYPTPQAEERSSALVGSVRVDDPLGDVIAPDGASESELPAGLDITGSSLEGDGSRLMATWYLPDQSVRRLDDGSRLAWVISIWQDEQPLYQLTVALDGRDWSIYVLDADTGDRAHFRLASLYVDRVEAPFPAHVLTKITGPFAWQAEVTWKAPDGSVWIDRAPETPMQFP